MKSCITFFLLAIMSLALGSTPAQAGLLLDITGPPVMGGNSSSDSTRGYSFTLTQGLVVTSLGIFDSEGDGLATDHGVGLWTDDGTLLASVTVPGGVAATAVPSAITGGLAGSVWRFADLTTSLTLAPGVYRLGAFYAAGNPDAYFFSFPASSIQAAPGVGVGNPYTAEPVPTLEFPSGLDTTIALGTFGPNLQGTPAAIPEPSSLALFATATAMLSGFGLIRRRRKQSPGLSGEQVTATLA